MTIYDLIAAPQHLRTPLIVAGWLVVALVAYVVVLLVGGASPVLWNLAAGLVGFDYDHLARRWRHRIFGPPAWTLADLQRMAELERQSPTSPPSVSRATPLPAIAPKRQ